MSPPSQQHSVEVTLSTMEPAHDVSLAAYRVTVYVLSAIEELTSEIRMTGNCMVMKYTEQLQSVCNTASAVT
jgi:hypothetical protein